MCCNLSLSFLLHGRTMSQGARCQLACLELFLPRYFPSKYHMVTTEGKHQTSAKLHQGTLLPNRLVIKSPSLWISALLLNCTQNGLLFQQITHSLAYSSHLKEPLHSSPSTGFSHPLHVSPGSLRCLGQWLIQRVYGLIRLWRAHWSSFKSIWYWLLLHEAGEMQQENQSRKVGRSHLGNRL